MADEQQPKPVLPGRNTLTLNQATIIAAVQYYFDRVLFAVGSSPTVTVITPDSSRTSTVFDVEVTEPGGKSA
jgi:hypothetical protein